MTQVKSFFSENKIWIITLVFTAGVQWGITQVQLASKVNKTDMMEYVDKKFAEHTENTKGQYVRIEQVPGLAERLKSIEDNVKETNGYIKELYLKQIKTK